MSTTPHTLSVVEDQLHALSVAMRDMADHVGRQLGELLDALQCADATALPLIVAADAQIDARHARIEEQLLGLLARSQPLARDLRDVLAAHRVALDLERIGDHVKGIAGQLSAVTWPLPAEITSRLLWFGHQAQALLRRAAAAYASADAAAVQRAWDEDAELDRMYHGLLAELLNRMRDNGAWVQTGVRLVMVAKSLERIGDHATNIAEEARFVALGEIVQAHRSV